MFKDNFQLTTMNCIDIYMFSALNIRNSYNPWVASSSPTGCVFTSLYSWALTNSLFIEVSSSYSLESPFALLSLPHFQDFFHNLSC